MAPDKKRIICSNADLIAGYTDNGFEIFALQADGRLHSLEQRNLERLGPECIIWVAADTLVAKMGVRTDSYEEITRYVKLLPLKL
jgi:hypothetical protein